MILLVSFAGEVLKLALPFPVPGSIYGCLLYTSDAADEL